MSNNQFGNSLYRSQRDMLDDIAYQWLGSGGNCGDAEREILAEMTDEELAAECIKGWQLNERSGKTELEDWQDEDSVEVELADSHMEEEDYSEFDLACAFERLRERLVSGDEEAV